MGYKTTTTTWPTEDEITFLKYLIKKNNGVFEKYVASIGLRKNWGKIYSHEIFDFISVAKKQTATPTEPAPHR